MNLARLKRRALKRANSPSLADAVFGGRWPRFMLRRAGFPIVRSLLSSFLHGLEAAAMALLFAPEYLTPLVSARLALSVSSGVLWAGTEGVRRDVRAALADGAHGSARRRLGQALRQGVIGSALVLAAGGYYVYASPQRAGYFTVVDAYILASCLRIASSIPVRVMQAGAHAVRRVYRPFASFLVPDMLDGFSIFLLWRWLGPWSVPIGMVLVGLLKLALTWRYTSGTLRQLRLAGASAQPAARTPHHEPRPRGSSLAWWAAGAAQTAPSWIVLGLWDAASDSESMAATLWVLYAMRPVAALLPRLGGVFYVDLVRARRMELAEARLLRRLRGSLGVAGLTLGLVAALASQDLGLSLALLCFYAVNGLFGLESVRVVAFAPPWRSLAPALLAMFPASLLWLEADSTLVVVVAVLSFALGVLSLHHLIPPPDRELDGQTGLASARDRTGRPLSLIAWLGLKGHQATTLVKSLESHRVARELAADPRWQVTRIDRRHLLVFGPPPASWSVQTAGLVEGAFTGPPASPADGLLGLAQTHAPLRGFAHQLSGPIRNRLSLPEDVRALCETAVVLSSKHGSYDGDECADSLREARRSAFVSSVRRGPTEACALWEDGRMKLVVVIPRTTAPRERALVRELLFAQSLARARHGSVTT